MACEAPTRERSGVAAEGTLAAEVIDFESDDIAGAEIARGLHAEADAGRGAGGDDVAGFEGHELRQIMNEERHVEDHRASAAVLAWFVVDPEAKAEIGGIGNFVRCDEPGAEGIEGVARFSLGPLATAFELEGALGDVVGNAVASDARGGFGGGGKVAGFAGDHDAEFDLPIGFFGTARDEDVVVGADDGVGGFEEDDGLGGKGHAGFGGVVGVVETDADEFAGARDAAAEAGVGGDQRECIKIYVTQFFETSGLKEGGRPIGRERGGVTQAALGIDEGGFFLAEGAEAGEAHGSVESVRVSVFQFGNRLVERFERVREVGVGVGEAQAGLFGGDGNLINAALEEGEAEGFVGGQVVARGDVPPVLRKVIHEINATGAAQARDERAETVATENLLLAVLELRAHVLEF